MVLRGAGIRRYDLFGCTPSHTPVIPLFKHSIARFTSPLALRIIALGTAGIDLNRRQESVTPAPRVRLVPHIAQEEFN